MKSKKIVYFDENIGMQDQDKQKNKNNNQYATLSSALTDRKQRNSNTNANANGNQNNKNSSINKTLREASINKHRHTPSVRLSAADGKGSASAQKIRLLITKDGFIFQKKYMIYDIFCTLNKFDKKFGNQTPSGSKQRINTNSQQSIASQTMNQQDFIFLNIQTSFLGVTKNMVRHNFPIERQGSNYIQIRAPGYMIDNIVISNKKIQYVQITNQLADANLDQHEITIIEPIKLIQETQIIREQKLIRYTQKLGSNKFQGRPASKSLNFCWNLQQSIENVQTIVRPYSKKSQGQGHSSLMVNLFTNQISANAQKQNIKQRQSSKSKRISKNSSTLSNQNGQCKTPKQGIMPKLGLYELIKPSKQTGMVGSSAIPKVTSRKFLNDSGVGYSGINKLQSKNSGSSNTNLNISSATASNININNEKDNKRQDAYGLEQPNKKVKSKASQNEELKKFVQPYELDYRSIDLEPSRYGYGLIKKKSMKKIQ